MYSHGISERGEKDSPARVVKCHVYGEYIRVKNWKVGVKSLGEYTELQNQVLFLVNLSK